MDAVINAAINREAIQVSERVHWIGALDSQLRTFDLILQTANGTTYNAYLLRGSEGVAVIDTVKEEFAQEFFTRLESIADYSEIKVIVLNHLEPDHTGALPELLQRAPQAQVYISFKAPKMLKALLKDEQTIHFNPVATGDEISLGDRHLRFLHTPYLHWPDTQCTYLPEDQILFSGDIFGCHFCDTRLFNDLCGDFRFSFEYYYAHIMRPFRKYVLEALEHIEPLKLDIIAPAHGPILRDHPDSYVQRFRELAISKLPKEHGTDKTLLIFYLSSYGNTARMAKAVCDGAETVDNVRVSLYDLAGGEVEPFVNLIEEAEGIVLGSPTINGDATKPMWDLMSSLVMIETQGKLGAAFGSYGWSGEAVDMLESRMRGLKFKVPVPGVRVKLIPTKEELQRCHDFGVQLGKVLTGKTTHKVIDFEDLL